jgi:hypothetical protein
MLEHGLQGAHLKRLLVLPQRRADQPDPARLCKRYERFRATGCLTLRTAPAKPPSQATAPRHALARGNLDSTPDANRSRCDHREGVQ